MTEEEFLERWYQARPAVEAWGKHVADTLVAQIAPRVSPLTTDVFVRIPVKPRLKQDGSLLTKAFYRNKPYKDPLEEITDKVGVRIVVLLPREIATVCAAIEGCAEWEWSKDRDYEDERAKSPYEFGYQSVHYIVRSRAEKENADVAIPPGTSCEVQVRTLLQHAHSEVTHDTIYKPSVTQTPEMHRAAAKAMALVEATSDYFEDLTNLISEAVASNKRLSAELAGVYRDVLGIPADPTKAEGLLNDAYAPFGGNAATATVRQLLEKYPFVIERVRERAATKLLFRQPSILLVYVAVLNQPGNAAEVWPFTPAELKPIFTDLGQAAPTS